MTASQIAGYNGTIFAYGQVIMTYRAQLDFRITNPLQTGSGKTHTIQGFSNFQSRVIKLRGARRQCRPSPARHDAPGVSVHVCSDCKRGKKGVKAKKLGGHMLQSGGRVKYSVRASFLEIYNERIYDLLVSHAFSVPIQTLKGTQFTISDPPRRHEERFAGSPREQRRVVGVFVDNLTEVAVSSADEILKVMEVSRCPSFTKYLCTRRECKIVAWGKQR